MSVIFDAPAVRRVFMMDCELVPLTMLSSITTTFLLLITSGIGIMPLLISIRSP